MFAPDVIPSEARDLQWNAVPTAAAGRFLAAEGATARNDNQMDPLPVGSAGFNSSTAMT